MESFSLTRPSASNGWTSITAYLDEVGQLKGLPLNKRASALAGFCGFDNIQLLGDIYIGRTVYSKGLATRKHVDFTLEEVDSSSPWIRQAHQDNYEHGMATGRIDMSGGSTGATHELLSKEMESSNPSQSYKWSQTEDSVDVTIRLKELGAAGVSRKELDVIIKPTHLTICHKGLSVRNLLDISLFSTIRPSESTWSMSGGEVEVNLEKASESVWKQLEE